MRIKGIRHTCLAVKDMARMVAFYQGLGIKKFARDRIEGGEYLEKTMGLPHASAYVVYLEAEDGSLLELLQMFSHPDEDRSHISFSVENLGEGAESPFNPVKTKWIQDPEGNWLECVEVC